jgi:hypothetical protein
MHLIEQCHFFTADAPSMSLTYCIYIDGTTVNGDAGFGPPDVHVTVIACWFRSGATAEIQLNGAHAFLHQGPNYFNSGGPGVVNTGGTVTTFG